MIAAGITALSVYFPRTVRRNDWWRAVAPEFIASLEQRAAGQTGGGQVWEGQGGANPWQEAMAPYLSDVFRGTTARRVLAPGETAHDLEERAARRLLDAAGLGPADIDLVQVSCLFPDPYVLGDAIGLAERLGFSCPCINVESACGVAVADFACRVLGLPPERVVDTYARTANTGPVLMPQNLYEGARRGLFNPGDDVLLFTLGSLSTSGAAVMRMSELVLAPDEDDPVEEDLGALRAGPAG